MITKERLDQIFDSLRMPSGDLLSRHGIELGKPNSKGWMALSTCPWCKHGPSNGQCGVLDTKTDKGFLHAVSCMHPHDSPSGESSPHWADFIAELGAITHEEAAHVKSLKSVTKSYAQTKPVIDEYPVKTSVGLLNEENNRRSRKRLAMHPQAMEWLLKTRGYKKEIIERFKLGLSEPYEKEGEIQHSKALTAPLIGFDGRAYKKYVNYVIPGVTHKKTNDEKNAKAPWSPGEARAYYNGDARGKPWLFVCDGLKDLWALSQMLDGTTLDKKLVLTSSTNGGFGYPAEWKTSDFWEQWEIVFFGHDNDKPQPLTGVRAGDEHALKLAKIADRDVLRVSPPAVKDWNDFLLTGKTVEDFQKLLEAAETIKTMECLQEDDGKSEGRFSANPVQIVGAFNNGYLYEAVRTLIRTIDKSSGEVFEAYDIEVVRSDRTRHRVTSMWAPKGTPEQNIVSRLRPDGTLVTGHPEPNPNLTWRWTSIDLWLRHKDKTPPLSVLVRRIENHLRGSVWLPHTDDYSILTCTVVASFVQEVFEAVPLLLVTGPAASGKSELGMAMKSIGKNSKNVLGVVSAATIARFIDSTRGLVVIDDLEEISGIKDSAFGDVVQTLKLSYKKATAQKMVTEIKNGKAIQRSFNFFGIKVINNTQGADSILGTRMFTIQTRVMPKVIKIQKELQLSSEALDDLRDELHCWSFSNVAAVNESYQAIFPNKTGRQEEISAPLRVIAALSGSEALHLSLERALANQEKVKKNPDSPEELLREALVFILQRSIEQDGVIPTWVTITQVMMEMSNLVDNNYGKEFTTSLSLIEKPEWVGRQLRQVYARDPNALQARTNMFGKGLRAYELSEEFINTVLENIKVVSPDVVAGTLEKSKDFKAFCRGCTECPYRNKCDMQVERKKSGRG